MPTLFSRRFSGLLLERLFFGQPLQGTCRRIAWGALLYGVCSLALAQNTAGQAPTTPLNTPTPANGSVDQVLSNLQYAQLCSTEQQFNYFQHACLVGQASNAQQISDAWIIFRARNRNALAVLHKTCQSSKRWPTLVNQMVLDEQRANLEWRQKTPEQIEDFCGRLPAALLSAEMEESLRKFADTVK